MRRGLTTYTTARAAITACAVCVGVLALLSLGGLFAGLLANAGIGLIVLFRTNSRLKENLTIVAIMYLLSVAAGILIQLIF